MAAKGSKRTVSIEHMSGWTGPQIIGQDNAQLKTFELTALTQAETIGEASEIFNYAGNAAKMAILANLDSAKGKLRALAKMLLINGKDMKARHRATVLNIQINLDSADQVAGGFKDSIVFLKIAMPTEATTIGADDINPERMKVLMRGFIVDESIPKRFFGAISASCGYAALVTTIHNYVDDIKHWVSRDAIDEYNRTHPGNTVELAMATSLFRFRSTIQDLGDYWDLYSMYAASVSQKEIYPQEVSKWKGLPLFTLLHCFMNDAYNHASASQRPAQEQAKFAQTQFTKDFKRRAAARGVELQSRWADGLLTHAGFIAGFITKGSGMSESDARLLNALEAAIGFKR